MNDSVYPASYTNTSAYTDTPGNVIISDLSQSYPTAPLQYNDQNAAQFFQNNSSLFNPLNMTNYSQNNPSEIFTFEIPGIKIIVIPTFPPMASSFQTNHSEIFTFDIPGSKVIIITLSFQ
ncbi:560_t:CDS:1 [Rhizophagus irregularis]|nr:560_t:CDS:1 [Rhizophagus irregularis]